MISRLTHSPCLIGIALDRSVAHLAQARRNGSPHSCTLALPHQPWPDHAWSEIAAQIAGAVERRGFRGRDVAVCPPPWCASAVAVQLPPRSSGAPLDQIATTQLAESLGAPAESLACCWWETPVPAARRGPAAGQALAAIACGGPQAGLEALAHALVDCGLQPRAVVPRSWALACALAAPGGDGAAGLEVGWHGALLAVARNRIVHFERWLPEHGLAALVDRIGEKTGLSADAAALLAAGPADTTGLDTLRGHPPSTALLAAAAGMVRSFAHGLAAEALTSIDYCGAASGVQPASLAVVAPAEDLARGVTACMVDAGFAGPCNTLPAWSLAQGAAASLAPHRAPAEVVA